MRLRELGSSGGWSAAAVPCSGYLLETGDQKILVDAGTGVTTEPLQHCSLADLDAFMDIPSAMAEVFDIHELTDGSSWQFAPLTLEAVAGVHHSPVGHGVNTRRWLGVRSRTGPVDRC